MAFSSLTQQQKVEFLALMREGVSVLEAGRRLNLTRSRISGTRKADKEFGAAVRQAMFDTADIRRDAVTVRVRSSHAPAKLPRSGLSGGLKKTFKYVDPFLDGLAHGMSPTKAAEVAQVALSTVYSWRQDDPEFAQRWAEAIQQGNDRLEDEAYRRGVEGYNERPVFDKDGRQVATIRDYSDTLLMQRLRGRLPEVYNRPDLSLSAKVEVRLTREQALERMQQFGLPVPQLTTEFEDDADRIDDGPDRKQ